MIYLYVYYVLFLRGMNCLHVLASYSRENAHLIFSCLLEFYPKFPLDVQDAQGNTGLFKKKHLDFNSKALFSTFIGL